MRFKQGLCAISAGLTLLSLQGCGLFGNKQDPSSILNYPTGNAGCLDNVGNQATEFASGKITAEQLTSAWTCVASSLTLFGQFIRGSVPDGYTTQDIQVFMSHFLFTQAPINLNLVQSIFALKASILGGTADVLTFEEVNKVLSLMSVLQTESTLILPYLASRAQNPTPKNLLLLSNSIRLAGKHLAVALQDTGSNPTFSADQIETLVTEIQTIVSPTASASSAGSIGQFITSIKQILALGGSGGIEGSAWPALLESLASYLGPALSAMSYSATFATGINPEGGLLNTTIGQLTDALDATIQVNGGSIPFSAVSNMIQYVPDSLMTASQRSAISGAQSLIFTHLLQSKTPNAIDKNVTAYLMHKVGFWNRIQTLLETIYSQNGLDPEAGASAEQLTAALPTGVSSQDQAAAQWVTALIQNYKPYFVADDSEVTFSPLDLYSLHDMSMKHLIRLISTALLTGYSTATDKTHIDFTDFKQLVDDLTPVLAAYQMTDPTIPNSAEARFLQANLFMPSSNGDDYVDLNEGSQYILDFLSIYNQAQRVLPLVKSACHSYGTDPYGAPLMNSECFRTAYYANYEAFWDRMPLLTKYFQGLSASDQQSVEVSIEAAGRLYGYSSQCVGMYDIQGFGGILHYVENLMERFDLKGNGILDTTETMTAFPVFQNELITAGQGLGLSATDTGEQQAAFAYAVAHGVLPPTGFWGDVEFAWWWLIVGQGGWDIQAPRGSLYNVVAGISPPPAPPSASQCQ